MKPSSGRKTIDDRDRSPLAAQGEVFHWRTFDPATLPGGLDAPLATELVTYRDHLDEMLRDHSGEFVVIRGDRIISYHPNRPSAVKAAFQSFGRESVLIKQVVETEPIRHLGGSSS